MKCTPTGGMKCNATKHLVSEKRNQNALEDRGLSSLIEKRMTTTMGLFYLSKNQFKCNGMLFFNISYGNILEIQVM